MIVRIPVIIRVRRGTSTQWTNANPVLHSGEFGYETNTGKLKIGNGTDVWNNLSYLQGSGGGGADGLSAYEIAVENGFVGTEQEWLDSLSPIRYLDADIFEGDGETEETKTTIKEGSLGENHLSEEVKQKLEGIGQDGREVQLQKSTTHIQWRYVGEDEWTNLVALVDITGEKGDPATIDNNSITEEKLSPEVRGKLNDIGIVNEKKKYRFLDHFLMEPLLPYRSVGTGSGVSRNLEFGNGNSRSFGCVQLNTGTTATGYTELMQVMSGDGVSFELGRVKSTIEYRVLVPFLSDNTNDFEISIGYENNNFGSAGRNKIIFRYNHAENDGRWQCVTRNSSIETVIDSGISLTDNLSSWCLFRIDIDFDSSVNFYINNVLVGSPSTNIPPAISPVAGILKKSGTTNRILVLDWIKIEAEFLNEITTP